MGWCLTFWWAGLFNGCMKLPSFQRLLDEHADGLRRFLVGYVGWEEAEDCWQETLLAALEAYPGLRHGRNLRGWLFTIARRKALDCLRRRARDAKPLQGMDGMEAAAELPDWELWGRVAALPEKQRAAVTLRFLADLPYAEVAEAMGISEAAARQNVRAGLASLRKAMPGKET